MNVTCTDVIYIIYIYNELIFEGHICMRSNIVTMPQLQRTHSSNRKWNYSIIQVDICVIFIAKHKTILVTVVVEASGFSGGCHVSV